MIRDCSSVIDESVIERLTDHWRAKMKKKQLKEHFRVCMLYKKTFTELCHLKNEVIDDIIAKLDVIQSIVNSSKDNETKEMITEVIKLTKKQTKEKNLYPTYTCNEKGED